MIGMRKQNGPLSGVRALLLAPLMAQISSAMVIPGGAGQHVLRQGREMGQEGAFPFHTDLLFPCGNPTQRGDFKWACQ